MMMIFTASYPFAHIDMGGIKGWEKFSANDGNAL